MVAERTVSNGLRIFKACPSLPGVQLLFAQTAEVVPADARSLAYVNLGATFRALLPPQGLLRFFGLGFLLGFVLLLPRRIGLAYRTLWMDTAG